MTAGVFHSGGLAGQATSNQRTYPTPLAVNERFRKSGTCPESCEESPVSKRDRILVYRCIRGDQDAWRELVRSYNQVVFNQSYRFTGRRDIAEDLTQEIFLRAYRNLESFRSESASFRTWLYRVGRNLLIDHVRKEKRSTITFFDHSEENLSIQDDRSPGPLRLMEMAEAAKILSAGLMSLAPELRQAITLRELEGLSYREIARIAGTVEGTIKSRVSRGRLQLARLLVQRRLKSFCHPGNSFGFSRFQIGRMPPQVQTAVV